MACHISRENNANHALAEHLKVVKRVFAHKIELWLIQHLEGLRYMPVLLYSLVAVPDCAFRDRVDVVCVVEAIMVIVVTDCCNNGCEHVKFV